MMKKIIAFSLVYVFVFGVATMAFAAPNPSGTGQPSQTCLSSQAPLEPGKAALAPGSAFNEVNGVAGSVYAGNGISAIKANSPHAVSQYDVACYQISTNHR